ncbi:MAG: hypothetical protein HC828_14350, partial [Blastochloris sp.]|nr:hypothetical protein [Blastochloris sp.]
QLPFPQGQRWYFTGGPHGGWGTGSAWSAVDFAPPDDLETVSGNCYISQYAATAVAAGVIARTDEGTVILDLDGDGDETTGWTILYLHIAAEGRIEEGVIVEAGDQLGFHRARGVLEWYAHSHRAPL